MNLQFSLNHQVRRTLFGVRIWGYMLQVWDNESRMWLDIAYVPRKTGQRIVSSTH